MAVRLIVAFALLVTFVTTTKYTLDFEEKEGDYTEDIEIDKQSQTVKYNVPEHAGVEHAQYLTDYSMQLSIMKLDSSKKCYAIPLPADEPSPDSIEAGLKQTNGKFPGQKYWAENINILPVTELDPTTLTKAVRDFCGSFPVVQVIKTDEKDMERVAINAAKAYQAGRSKRQGTRTITEFITCDRGNELTIAGCPPHKLITKCKFVAAKTCVYRVACTISDSGWNCPGVHSWHILHCCNYSCS